MTLQPIDDDSGPAFPYVYATPSGVAIAAGMTLRDYFAAQALPAIIAARASEPEVVTLDEIAQESYLAAERMLVARRHVPQILALNPSTPQPPNL